MLSLPHNVSVVEQNVTQAHEDGYLGAILVENGVETDVGAPIAVVCDEETVSDELHRFPQLLVPLSRVSNTFCCRKTSCASLTETCLRLGAGFGTFQGLQGT
eukprot:1179179-Prorocentrum_minimum.AAC.4